jgi:hypothetical protein
MKEKSKPHTWMVDYYLKGPNKTGSLKIMFSGRNQRSTGLWRQGGRSIIFPKHWGQFATLHDL